MNISWVATLSNGTTEYENSGNYQIVEGERKPWVRLCTFLAENGLHLTSLRLNVDGRTIHMPRERFKQFNFDEVNVGPNSYSLQYQVEVDDIFGAKDQKFYIDLAAHYDDFIVHLIQDCNDGNTSWVVVTQPHDRLAETPPKAD